MWARCGERLYSPVSLNLCLNSFLFIFTRTQGKLVTRGKAACFCVACRLLVRALPWRRTQLHLAAKACCSQLRQQKPWRRHALGLICVQHGWRRRCRFSIYWRGLRDARPLSSAAQPHVDGSYSSNKVCTLPPRLTGHEPMTTTACCEPAHLPAVLHHK